MKIVTTINNKKYCHVVMKRRGDGDNIKDIQAGFFFRPFPQVTEMFLKLMLKNAIYSTPRNQAHSTRFVVFCFCNSNKVTSEISIKPPHWWPFVSNKGASNKEHDSIWWRHHDVMGCGVGLILTCKCILQEEKCIMYVKKLVIIRVAIFSEPPSAILNGIIRSSECRAKKTLRPKYSLNSGQHCVCWWYRNVWHSDIRTLNTKFRTIRL